MKNKFLTQHVQKLHPYVAGLQPQEPGWIKLNTNENPYPPSPKIAEAIKNLDLIKLKLYPPGDGGILREAIAAAARQAIPTTYTSSDMHDTKSVANVISTKNIFCGNGSDEVLALAFQAFYSGKTPVHTPDISYGFYPVWGGMYNVGLNFIPLKDDFSLDPGDYTNGQGVIIANPNAPTGMAVGLETIEKILQQNPNGVVLVDEAYIDFASVPSAVELIPRYENLLVVRTFSKSHALAGMRVGYAIGQPHLIEGLELVKESFNSYPLDIMAQTAAAAAIEDTEYLKETCAKVIATRKRTTVALEAMGYKVLPAEGNFIFIEVGDAKGLYERLLANKILARYWDKPRINTLLRVSIGTDEEMERFISCVNS